LSLPSDSRLERPGVIGESTGAVEDEPGSGSGSGSVSGSGSGSGSESGSGSGGEYYQRKVMYYVVGVGKRGCDVDSCIQVGAKDTLYSSSSTMTVQ
jgi:hypothetical protein